MQYHAHFQNYNGVQVYVWLLALFTWTWLTKPFLNVQDILHLDEAAIRDQIGIKNSAHRSKIVSSLVLLKAKTNISN